MNPKAQASARPRTSTSQQRPSTPVQAKTLTNTSPQELKSNVPDATLFGDPDTWKLICKASSQNEGWMKSTKAMQAGPVGTIVQTTTQQRNRDGSYSLAEAVVFVPGVKIVEEKGDAGQVIIRKLQHV